MNIAQQNGITLSSGNNEVYINGERIITPKGMSTNIQTIINGKIYIGGYEYFPKNKAFKRTLVALWHYLF